MGRDLKDILEVGKLMGRGNYNFLKVKSSKENLKTVMKIEKGSFNIWINQFLRVHGKMTKRKDLENIYHQMEQYLKVFGIKISLCKSSMTMTEKMTYKKTD